MSERFENPTAGRAYLENADYYRLGYQLSAQLMNAEYAEGSGQRQAGPATPGDFPPSNVATRASTQARRTAERSLVEVDELLIWYARRHEAKWWARRHLKKLRPKEKRLERFLSRTVRPCLELVIAASLRSEGDNSAAEKTVMALREAAKVNGALSYRVLYNLACYEAGGDGERPGEARRYLERALRGAPADRQEELAGWAERDPSLNELKGDEKSEELLARFQPEESQLAVDTTASAHADQAVELIVEEPGISVLEIAKTMKIKANYLHRVLGDLEKEGRVEKKGRQYFPDG